MKGHVIVGLSSLFIAFVLVALANVEHWKACEELSVLHPEKRDWLFGAKDGRVFDIWRLYRAEIGGGKRIRRAQISFGLSVVFGLIGLALAIEPFSK